jgi:hypothetical protein
LYILSSHKIVPRYKYHITGAIIFIKELLNYMKTVSYKDTRKLKLLYV